MAQAKEVRPSYYRATIKATVDGKKRDVEVECFDVIDALADGDFYLGNAWKYLFRLGRKSPDPEDDLAKVETYLAQYRERRLG